MQTSADQCLKKTLQLADRMLRLAENGDAVRDDPGCGVVYGMLRDSAYKIKQLAEAERQAHLRQDRRPSKEAENDQKDL
ncbi:MAG: hypothetical protein NTW80_08720 [Deltaproteobacteria bacterium]|nr:hypothetical protein [Deltaproteobacteria bacterium]